MTEVYINEERLELGEQTFVQTFQLNNIGVLDSSQTSYTNKIKVPRTPKNIRIFNNLGVSGAVYTTEWDTNNATKFPYGLPNCKIVESGIELVVGGFASVLNSDNNFYYIAIYGAERSFFEELKSYKLVDVFPAQQVPISAFYLHTYRNNDDVFTFLMVNYHEGIETMSEESALTTATEPFITFDTNKVTPQFFVKDLITNIFDFLGYEYELDSTIENDFYYTNLLIAPSKGAAYFFGDGFSGAAPIDYGMNLEDFVPDMQADVFLSEIMRRFGLMIRVDATAKKAYLKNIDNVLNDNAIDWSSKFSNATRRDYKLPDYAQNSYLEYQNDTAIATPEDTQENEMRGNIEVENLSLDFETTLLYSKFNKPTYATQLPQGAVLGNGVIIIPDRSVVPTTLDKYPLLDFTDLGGYDTDGAQTTTFFDAQLLHRTRVDKELRIRYENQESQQTNIVAFFYLATYIETRFQKYLDDYQSRFMSILTGVEQVTANFNLNTLDIYHLDFFKPYYIEQLGGLFYLNKVSNFKNGKLTEIEVIKIPGLTFL